MRQEMTTLPVRSRSHSGFTLVELLVVIAIIATLAGLLVPTIMGARAKADRTVCLNNLKELGKLAMSFADDHKGVFPIAKGSDPPAYLSLQKIVEDNSEFGLPSQLFVCPSSLAIPADKDETNSYQLDEDSNSYAWIAGRTKTTGRSDAPLGSDDSIRDASKEILENHAKGMNVVYVGLHAEWVPTDSLPEERTLLKGLIDNQGNSGGGD